LYNTRQDKLFVVSSNIIFILCIHFGRGCCGRDRMVVGFTTTYAISAYRH